MDDEDFHFLMSLLPHLKDIPKQRKLSVKIKLQQVLMKEEERRDIYENSTRPSTFTLKPSIIMFKVSLHTNKLK